MGATNTKENVKILIWKPRKWLGLPLQPCSLLLLLKAEILARIVKNSNAFCKVYKQNCKITKISKPHFATLILLRDSCVCN